MSQHLNEKEVTPVEPPATAADQKEVSSTEVTSPVQRDIETGGHVPPLKGWMYKSFKGLPWYASPPTQLVLVSFVCFLCPGMFNAVNGLGGGGLVDATVADNSNVAVYSTFAVVGFFAGTVVNRLGIKMSLSFGGIGYFIYVASYLSYNHNQNAGFVIFAGAFLGVCAGILWAAQGGLLCYRSTTRLMARSLILDSSNHDELPARRV